MCHPRLYSENRSRSTQLHPRTLKSKELRHPIHPKLYLGCIVKFGSLSSDMDNRLCFSAPVPVGQFTSKRTSSAFIHRCIGSSNNFAFMRPVIRSKAKPITCAPRPLEPSCSLVAGPYVRRVDGIPVLNIDSMSRRSPSTFLLVIIAAAISWVWRRYIVLKHLSTVYKRDNLAKDIAGFYDTRSAAWELVWGEHMHHGLYDTVEGKRLSGVNAQVRTMTELLRLGRLEDLQLPPGSRVLDVGCGIGGASRFLARHFGENCDVTGITLSPFQAQRATELNAKMGLQDRVINEVRDALDTGLPDNHFDVVWSLESGEHMENKSQFLKECARVLKPGGKMVMVAWCIRETSPYLTIPERFSIRKIMEEYCLPRVAPASEYNTEMLRATFRGVTVQDWTTRAAPFWGEVVRSAIFSTKGWRVLFRYGWPLIRSALAMRHVVAGIRQGVFKLVAFQGTKMTPEQIEAEARKEAGMHSCREPSTLPIAAEV